MIFLISVVLLLVCVCFFFVVVFVFLLAFHFGASDSKSMIFSVELCIWAIGGHELGNLSIRVHNKLTVHDNSWALKFDKFSKSQNTISDSLPPPSGAFSVIMTLCVKKSICDSPLRRYSLLLAAKFLGVPSIHFSDHERIKPESTLEPPTGFKLKSPRLIIQRLNH